MWGLGEGFGEIDAGDLGGDGMVDPAFLDERNEQGAGLFGDSKTKRMKGLGVGLCLDSGGGGEDEDVAGGVGGTGGSGTGIDDSDDGDGAGCGSYLVDGKGGCGIAGDDEEIGTPIEQELRAGGGVTGDGGLDLDP